MTPERFDEIRHQLIADIITGDSERARAADKEEADAREETLWTELRQACT